MPRKSRPSYETGRDIFPQRLRSAMQMRDVNQAQLAKTLGITPQAVSAYINGQSAPKPQTLAEIARALRVSSDYLLGLSSSYASDITSREICDRTNLTDYTVSALSQLPHIDFDALSLGNGRDTPPDHVVYVLNRIICALCTDHLPTLLDIVRYCLSIYEIGCSLDAEANGGSAALLIPPDSDYYKWQRWVVASGLDRLMDDVSEASPTLYAAHSFFAEHPDILWRDAKGEARGPLMYSDDDRPPQKLSFRQYEDMISSRLSEAIQQDLERMNHGIRKEETE